MNTLVVYDTRFGDTATIAQAVADGLAEYGTARVLALDEAIASQLDGIDLLVLGCPTHNHAATPAMQAWVERLPPDILERVPIAAFDTRYHMAHWLAGSAAGALAQTVAERGGVFVSAPESFFVTAREGPLEAGELDRAHRWADQVCRALDERMP